MRNLVQPVAEMQDEILNTAAEVIREVEAGEAADGVLRRRLARSRLSRHQAGEVSRAVFAYYRWRGFLMEAKSLPERIRQATVLQDGFAANPTSIGEAELASGCFPNWLAGEVEVSSELLMELQREPRMWLRARKGQGRELVRSLGRCDVPFKSMPEALVYRGSEDLFRTPQFQAGEFEIQDVASQAVGLICGPQPRETWWDACAGEGGKTLHLSDLMENQGLIWATDRSELRLKRLRQRTARARVFNYRVACWDGSKRLPTRTRFDGVLLDAPCSGVGTWQRNPHARWTTSMDDVRELARIQLELLTNVSALVKPGGKLVYAVCTLTRSETTEVASAFGGKNPEFAPAEIIDPFELERKQTGSFWIWPQEAGGNGMFLAAWIRA